MKPTNSQVHVIQPLSMFSVLHTQTETDFVADRVLPNVPVEHQSDTWFKVDIADMLRNEMAVVAPGTETAGSGFKIDTATPYYIPVEGVHKDLPDQVFANADKQLDLYLASTIYLTQQFLRRKEVKFVSAAYKAGVWGTNYTGVGSAPSTNEILRWDDAASSPVKDVDTVKTAVKKACGFMPNKMTISLPVFNALKEHEDIKDLVKYTSTVGNPSIVTEQALAQVFGVEEVLVMKGIQNTAVEGRAASNAFIASTNGVLLTYSPSIVSLNSVQAGLTLNWTGYENSFGGQRVQTFNIPERGTDRLELKAAWTHVLTCPEAGAFIATVLS